MEMLTRDHIDYSVVGHALQDIVNFNEVAVLKVLRQILQADASLCRCSLCVEDIYALALNAIPPRYIQVTSVSTYRGSVNYIAEEEVRRKVEAAVERVRSSPNH